MIQVMIFQQDDREMLEKNVNDWLADRPVGFVPIETKLSTASVVVDEDSWMVTTVMVVYREG